MRTISFDVYKFDELSEQAKSVALDKCRDSVAEFLTECDSSDYRATLEEIESCFNIKVRNWEVDEFGYHYRVDIKCDYDEDNPKMLLRYLNNEVFPNLRENHKRNYSSSFKQIEGKWTYKSRKSRVLYDNQYSCCLTGCWCDNGVDDAMNNAYDAVRKGWTIRDFVEDMLDKFFGFWKDDIEHYSDDEVVQDHIEENGYEFYENGSIYS